MKTLSCKYIGLQPTLDKPMPLFNLLEPLAEHPANSTVGEQTIRDAGYEVPAIEAEKARIDYENFCNKIDNTQHSTQT